jgi:hypothetical protein
VREHRRRASRRASLANGDGTTTTSGRAPEEGPSTEPIERPTESFAKGDPGPVDVGWMRRRVARAAFADAEPAERGAGDAGEWSDSFAEGFGPRSRVAVARGSSATARTRRGGLAPAAAPYGAAPPVSVDAAPGFAAPAPSDGNSASSPMPTRPPPPSSRLAVFGGTQL